MALWRRLPRTCLSYHFEELRVQLKSVPTRHSRASLHNQVKMRIPNVNGKTGVPLQNFQAQECRPTLHSVIRQPGPATSLDDSQAKQ